MKSKIASVFFLLLLTLGFITLQYHLPIKYRVLDVASNASICIDINGDFKCSKEERFALKGIDVFPVKYEHSYNLTPQDNKNLGNISNKYLKYLLLNKEIEFVGEIPPVNKKYPLRFATINIEGEDAAQIMLDNGLAVAYRGKDFNPYVLSENKKQINKNAETFAPLIPKETENFQKEVCVIEKRIPDGVFGSIEVYFVSPKYRYPSKRARTSAAQAILYSINNAKCSIDLALYGIEGQDEIYNALLNAKRRGVKVRAVVDSHPSKADVYYDTKRLRKDFNAVSDNSPAIMHNKFFIIDNQKVIVSSMNISPTGSGGYNSNTVLIIDSCALAKAYLNEFEQMHNGKFHTDKSENTVKDLTLDDNTSLGVYFSPQSNVYLNAIKPAVTSAKKEILVSAFYLTHKGLIEDLVLAKKRGVSVNVIIDALGASNFKERINYLRSNGVNVKVENWGGKNHEKNIDIDGCTFITGSANFSKNAAQINDENMLVINNCALGTFYRKRFFEMYNSIDNKYLTGFPRAEGFESKYSCYDGIDNDFDGKIDSYDDGCKKYPLK